MHLKRIHLKNFKRFTDTAITEMPATARMIVLAGPNGCGKSSILDGLKTWHFMNGGSSYSGWDESYGAKTGTASIPWPEHVAVDFHEDLPTSPDHKRS